MRKVAAAALAVPVVVLLIAASVVRRSLLVRLAVTFGLSTVLVAGIVAVTASRPAQTVATRPVDIAPVPRGLLRTEVRVARRTDAPVTISFSAPMDRTSVRASLQVEPPAAVRVEWNADATTLTVHPLGRWGSGRYYTVTVAPGALAASGAPLLTPVRAAFVTRPATAATLAATGVVGERIRLDAAFVVDVDTPLDASTVAGALRVDPPVAGAWAPDADVGRGARYVFTPVGLLGPDTTYTVELERWLRDAFGGAVTSQPLVVRTAAPATVVGIAPAGGTADVPLDASVSVRFSEAMDRAATEAALRVQVGETRLAGTLRWTDGDTVLVFDPAESLDHEQRVLVGVAATARSAIGVPLDHDVTASFVTIEKPPPPPPPPARPAPPSSGPGGTGTSTGSGASSGGSVGSATWTAVESYYLRLMNCTRTGGLVTSSGSCSSPGGRDVAPLRMDAGISSKVARPYAKLLATRNACSHFLDGNPGDRLRRAGYTSYIWAENLGCRSGDPYGAVLGSHLYFQAERSWSPQGGHYVNLMNRKYDRVGIGVWVHGGRVRLVVDFYHPR